MNSDANKGCLGTKEEIGDSYWGDQEKGFSADWALRGGRGSGHLRLREYKGKSHAEMSRHVFLRSTVFWSLSLRKW